MPAPYHLSDILKPTRLEGDHFVGRSPEVNWQRVFGGQVIGQALVAANDTVEGILAHSLHCYFVRPGNPDVPINYVVDRLKDGRSFVLRRIEAMQDGTTIFTMTASYHRDEPGPEFQTPMPDLPLPDDCPREMPRTFLAEAPPSVRAFFAQPNPIEWRIAHEGDDAQIADGVWLRIAEPLPADPPLHQAALAYLSDLTPLDAALARHGLGPFHPDIQAASLDHALWFHRTIDANRWHLFVSEPQSTGRGRGHTFGRVFDEAGRQVASLAQEGLTRPLK